MKLPRFSLWQLSAYAAFVLAVLVLFFLPQEWHEIKDATLAAGKHLLQDAVTWLLDGASRAWLVAMGIAMGAVCLYGYASLQRRINDMELRLLCVELHNRRGGESESGPGLLEPAAAAARIPHQPASVAPGTNGAATVVLQGRPKVDEVREPAEQLAKFLEATRRCKRLRVKPQIPDRPWLLGLACDRGNVREQNQDYGFYFLLDGRQVLVLADGCGGIPRGQRAAYLAAVEAACSIVKTYGRGDWQSCDSQLVARQAILDASSRLAKEGKRLHLVKPGDGLRTTLIVLIAQERDVAFCFIGDGGGCIMRTSGAVEHFLTPQKASPDQPNVLAASLGPQMEGEPVVGTIQRNPGDLILVGTDGIFDRVNDSFPKDVLRAAIQCKGDLMKTAGLIVEELASTKDDLGYVCDDNLTLGIMGDGSAPVLAPGFWNARKVAQEEANNPKGEGVSDESR